jgi:hypothetical protein
MGGWDTLLVHMYKYNYDYKCRYSLPKMVRISADKPQLQKPSNDYCTLLLVANNGTVHGYAAITDPANSIRPTCSVDGKGGQWWQDREQSEYVCRFASEIASEFHNCAAIRVSIAAVHYLVSITARYLH